MIPAVNARLAIFSLVLGATSLCRAGTVYDPTTDYVSGWTTQSNPNGVWSYGYSSGFTDAITLYNETVEGTGDLGNIINWVSSADVSAGVPAATFNDGPALNNGNLVIPADEFGLGAGFSVGDFFYSDLVFTAPADGIYSVVGDFLGDQYNIGVVVGVVADGTVVYNSSLSAQGQTDAFGTDVSLSAGDTVVFSVGSNGIIYTNAGLSVTITQTATPEPSTLALVGGGIVLLAFRGLRSKI